MSEGFGTGSAYLRTVLEKQDAVVSEMRPLPSDMHGMVDSRLQRLEDEIAEIRAKPT